MPRENLSDDRGDARRTSFNISFGLPPKCPKDSAPRAASNELWLFKVGFAAMAWRGTVRPPERDMEIYIGAIEAIGVVFVVIFGGRSLIDLARRYSAAQAAHPLFLRSHPLKNDSSFPSLTLLGSDELAGVLHMQV